MKTQNLRTLIAAAVFGVMTIGLVAGVSTGTLSGFGWDTIAALCPLGALGTMIATKTMIPRAVISLVIMAALVLLVGRAFCAWLCPTTLIYRIRDYFRSPKKRKVLAEQKNAEIKAISQQELDSLKPAKGAKDAKGHACGACGKCQPVKHGKLDSRHAVLGGALLRLPGVLPGVPGGPHLRHGARAVAGLLGGRRHHRHHSHPGHAHHRDRVFAEVVHALLPAVGPHEPGGPLLAHLRAGYRR